MSLLLNSQTALVIGKNLTAQLDYLSIWKEARASCHLLRSKPLGNEKTLVLHYDFNYPSGATTIFDLSNVKNDGELEITNNQCDWLIKVAEPAYKDKDLCSKSCSFGNSRQSMVRHWGSGCNGILYFYQSSSKKINKIAVYDSKNKLRYYYDALYNEVHQFNHKNGLKLNINYQPMVKTVNALETDLGGKAYSVYVEYVEYGRSIFAQTKGTLNNQFQEFTLQNSSSKPSQIDYPYPLLRLGSQSNGRSLKLERYGNFKGYDLKGMSLYNKDDLRLAFMRGFTDRGFQTLVYDKGKMGKAFQSNNWGKGVFIPDINANETQNLYIKNVKGNLDYFMKIALTPTFWKTGKGVKLLLDWDGGTSKCRFVEPVIGKEYALGFQPDHFVKIKNSITLGNAFTFETRVYLDTYKSSHILYSKGGAINWRFNRSRGLVFEGDFPGGVTASLNSNQWYHLAITYDGQTLRFFKDGKETNAKALNKRLNLKLEDITLGSLTGKMDYFCIWNRAKSASEINASKGKKLAVSSGMELLYNFDEGPGTFVIYDKSGKGRHGALMTGTFGYELKTTTCEFDWTDRNATLFTVSEEGNRVLDPRGKFKIDLGKVGLVQGGINSYDFTIQAYIRLEDLSGISTVGGLGKIAALQVENGKPKFTVRGASIMGTDPLIKGKWYHLSATYAYNGGAFNLYLNGRKIVSKRFSVPMFGTDPQTVSVGFDPSGNNFKGYLDQFRLWNFARNQSQLIEDMQNKTANSIGLLTGYNFDWPKGIVEDVREKMTNFKLRSGAGKFIDPKRLPKMDFPVIALPKPIDQALVFKGTVNPVTIGDLTTSGNAFTIETWVKPSNLKNEIHLFRKEKENRGSHGTLLSTDIFGLRIKRGKLQFYQPGKTICTANYDLQINQWYHVAASYNGSQLNLYLNGQQVATGNYSGLKIEGKAFVADALSGEMDRLAVWNNARSAQQIKAKLFTLLNGSESGLQHYYNFDDQPGKNTLKDISKNGKYGQLSGQIDVMKDWVPSTVPKSIAGLSKLLPSSTQKVGEYALSLESSTYMKSERAIKSTSTTKLFSIKTWVYIDKPSNNIANIVGVGSSGLKLWGTTLFFELEFEDKNYIVDVATRLKAGRWYLLQGVYESSKTYGDKMWVSVDGRPVGEIKAPRANMLKVNGLVKVGGPTRLRSTQSNIGFAGMVDDVHIEGAGTLNYTFNGGKPDLKDYGQN